MKKKKTLLDNIKKLENLSKLFQASIEDVKKIIDEVNANNEAVKKEIQSVFTKIRTALNNREDELLKDVEKFIKKNFQSRYRCL